MDRRYRISFLTLFLTGCLQGNPIPRLLAGIDYLEENITCPDSVFYTPTDVEDSCIVAALACSIKELDTVKVECLDKAVHLESMQHHISMTATALQKTIDKENSTTDTSECICEDKRLEKSFKDFIQNIRHLTQAHAAKRLSS
ncbi:interleukin 2 precursor [Oncorhynchus mykiss]|uniref:Interleukin n=1 Tax=Oncorhynchus mykiss TaxID=8022 RepID=C7AL05_ONCMY|nr:interleukin 2 precursor [Oncorhynchus mykiss]ACT21085.1 interleukin-2 precursor [Oncorhynchus mykiss]